MLTNTMTRELEARRANRNKGFSLVELIIVIAIMVVLIAILAPQFLKYVEQSRQAADQTAADELYRTVTASIAEEGIVNDLGAQASGTSIVLSSSGGNLNIAITLGTNGSGGSAEVLGKQIAGILGGTYASNTVTISGKPLKSTKYNASGVTYTVLLTSRDLNGVTFLTSALSGTNGWNV
ncbi:hypothetical protein FACS18949_07770 [Clostridia bacterium]|nr:hypothetical protein FACS18949_07770 [Clostridia bacterium]